MLDSARSLTECIFVFWIHKALMWVETTIAQLIVRYFGFNGINHWCQLETAPRDTRAV